MQPFEVIEVSETFKRILRRIKIIETDAIADGTLNNAMVRLDMCVLFRCSGSSKLMVDFKILEELAYDASLELTSVVRSHGDLFREGIPTEYVLEEHLDVFLLHRVL